MSADDIRLRGQKPRLKNAWALGGFPKKIVIDLGKQIVHRVAIGQTDISGDDFGTLFAYAIGGKHLASPLGVADVVLAGNAWSVKTVKAGKPFEQKTVRLISGRISPDYSMGIKNPHIDIQATGKAILSIWNERINESLHEHNDLRIVVLIRNVEKKEFVLFEENVERFAADDFVWEKNSQGNFEGYVKATRDHRFTWQSHGSQFTIKRHIPGSAVKFSINQIIPLVDKKHILDLINFEEDWIKIVD